mgnify:CR=1 FL=1
MSPSKKEEIASRIESEAVSRYGDPTRRKVRPPLDQLVESLLWRYTSIRRGTRALRQLKRAFADWNEVRVSHLEEISSAMASTEWATQSAAQVKRMLETLFDLRSEMSLEFLQDLTRAQGRAFLQSLQGVTSDLADEVLLFSTDANLMPVNEDIARMAYRLGLVPNSRVTKKNQQRLGKLWDGEAYPAVCQFFLDHAPSVCTEEEPDHEECVLEELCPKEGLD